MKVDDDKTNANRCLCPDCPTYDACMGGNDERLYCARGATSCEPTVRRCICPDCSVYADYDLSGLYFCTKGAAV